MVMVYGRKGGASVFLCRSSYGKFFSSDSLLLSSCTALRHCFASIDELNAARSVVNKWYLVETYKNLNSSPDYRVKSPDRAELKEDDKIKHFSDIGRYHAKVSVGYDCSVVGKNCWD